MNFQQFKVKYFDIIDNTNLIVIKDYYYLYRFLTDYNFSPNKIYTTIILNVEAK